MSEPISETPSQMELETTAAIHSARIILVVLALLLPSLSLLPLGGMYLWEKGWLLYWALASLGAIALVYALQSYALRSSRSRPIPEELPSFEDSTWSDAERKAWSDVRVIAKTADPGTLTDLDGVADLAVKVVRAVAARLHPGSRDPEWKFTVPEALAISERVSRRLRRFVEDGVPFGNRLTVAQFLAIYRARGVIELADKAYDVWRVVRLVNPATAVTNEARERLTKAMFNWGKEHVARRVVEKYVEEVGRAAIDLYGGRLRPAAAPAGAHGPQTEPIQASPQPSNPLMRLISGTRAAVGRLTGYSGDRSEAQDRG